MKASKPIRLPDALRKIPPLPQVTARAMALIQDPYSSRSELVHVLSLDQGMTGMFLQMVNSAYYWLPRRVTSLDEAIGYLGYESVQEVVLAVSTNKMLSRSVPAYMLEKGMLWQHSVAVAAGSDWIAQQRKITPRSEAYVAGLLHDVGKLALDLMVNQQPEWSETDESAEEEEAWTEVEQSLTGYDHAEVGAMIVRQWDLPDRVVEAVAYHHDPKQAEIDPRLTAAVHIANAAALMAGIGLGVEGLRYVFDGEACNLIEWQERDLETLISKMHDAVAEAEETIKPER